MKILNKTIGFLDVMVKVVFVSTFIFTAVSMYISYKMFWESAMVTLIERWFTVMVGELVVMGIIQISKEVIQGYVRKAEMQFVNELDKDKYQ